MNTGKLHIYNTLSRSKELFKPIHDDFVGLYVCGPTVYNEVHLGNVRTAINFDVVVRYLRHTGYKVRYVRNITDVGHLVGDVDEGAESKIEKQAKAEQVQPMEVVHRYTTLYHEVMNIFNTVTPDIEPTATGHLIEQIEMVRELLATGYAYEQSGSVYFDTVKYVQNNPSYGQLSGKKVEDLLTETRDLKGQSEKRSPLDFAIWVKAQDGHLMRWPSPWSDGYPGWHLECSVMSAKYLGQEFDIHGGGMDLLFPHHENEIAQHVGCCGQQPVRYWMHTNMLTMNGAKMSKSKGNSVLPSELISGSSPLISRNYTPMVIRFFMLQTHYRSTLDFSEEALTAADKGFKRLMEMKKTLESMPYVQGDLVSETDSEVTVLTEKLYEHMNDDFSTAQTIARLFDISSFVNACKDGHKQIGAISQETFTQLQTSVTQIIEDVLGLKDDRTETGGNLDGLMQLVIELRQGARERKDWDTSDKIRDGLNGLGIQIKDGKEGTSWSKN